MINPVNSLTVHSNVWHKLVEVWNRHVLVRSRYAIYNRHSYHYSSWKQSWPGVSQVHFVAVKRKLQPKTKQNNSALLKERLGALPREKFLDYDRAVFLNEIASDEFVPFQTKKGHEQYGWDYEGDTSQSLPYAESDFSNFEGQGGAGAEKTGNT